MIEGGGFMVYGLEFGVSGFGFKLKSLRVSGLGFSV
jgi:hypothetical protein